MVAAAKRITSKNQAAFKQLEEDRELINNERRAKTTANEAAAQYFMARSRWFQYFIDGRGRNLDKDCGYPEGPTLPKTFMEFYKSDGIAQRVVDFLPQESWAFDPDVYEDSTNKKSSFIKEYMELVDRLNVYGELERADCLSRVGHYGGILLGFDDSADLARPVAGVIPKPGRPTKKQLQLLYMRPLDESLVNIAAMETDPNSPRYGQPTAYRITMSDPTADPFTGVAVSLSEWEVHWTRFLHLADNLHSSLIFGEPAMEPVFHRLLDIRKLLGGSAEMYWKGALPGISFETPAELAAEIDLDRDSIRKEIQAYELGLQRYLAIVGVTAKSLAPQVSSPKDQLMEQYRAIAMNQNCPIRVWMGSEEGKMAATQDSRAWGKRVARRQKRHNTPHILRPFTDRMIMVGQLPPYKKFNADWPDLHTPTSDDKANVARKMAAALKDYVVGGCGVIMAPEDFLVVACNVTEDQAKEFVKRAKLNKIATVPTGSTGLGAQSGGPGGAGSL